MWVQRLCSVDHYKEENFEESRPGIVRFPLAFPAACSPAALRVPLPALLQFLSL